MGKYFISSGIKQRNKPSHLSISEEITIVIAFHQSEFQDSKTYYIHLVCATSDLHKRLLIQI
ncbi:hypothetical protein [Candidatus Enterovibrio escicola]|uniref:hypothetical protein n=1 Tax=Candidatus Enterovibrio escicola TaxID=1927127 RepID=UPI001237FE2A|nr:hypothetical protein [Candidatus Enterovibrio escacola]